MDKRAKQTIAIGGLCGVIGLTLGMIIMAVWGPYAMERTRQERNAAAYEAELIETQKRELEFQKSFPFGGGSKHSAAVD